MQPSLRNFATESVVGGLSALAVPGSFLEMEHLRPHPYSETHWLRFCIFTGNVWSACTAKFEKQYLKPFWAGFSVLSISTATIFNRSAGPTYLNTGRTYLNHIEMILSRETQYFPQHWEHCGHVSYSWPCPHLQHRNFTSWHTHTLEKILHVLRRTNTEMAFAINKPHKREKT